MTSADDLARSLVALLGVRSVADVLRSLLSARIDDRRCGRCPRCGRSLPLGSVGPAFKSFGKLGAMGIPHTDQERTAACLVDGRRARSALDLPLADLLGAAQTLTTGLRDRGWGHWARVMQDALARRGSAERAEAVGQALELIRRAGPRAMQARPELDTLVTSLARHWPQEQEDH